MGDDRKAVERLGKVFFDSYFVVDAERRIIDFNDGFVQLLGLRPAERRKIMGSKCYDLLRLSICKDRCIALQSLSRNDHVRMEEIAGKTPADRDLVLEISAIPLRDEHDKVSSVFVTHRDVTDERRLKTRYTQEQEERRTERETLLKIIHDRDDELQRLRTKVPKPR